jgi:DNA-directed RNA polymerase specialized sigma24 family protein
MAVAVTIEQAGRLLKGLDAESRALLDLSLRRGMDDEEIAVVLNVTTAETRERIDGLIDRLADELELDGREQRAELRATLPDLPPELWKG